MGQKYRRMEDQKLGPMLVRNQDFAEGEELEPKIEVCYLGRRGEQTSVTRRNRRLGARRFFVI